MGFYQIDKPRKSQVSLSSWEGAKQSVKDDANNVKELAKGTVKVAAGAVGDAVRGTARKLIHDGRNSDLKSRMHGHSSFKERTRSDD